MREIKFRALELDTGNMVYGYYVKEHGYWMNNGIPDLNQSVVRHYIYGESGTRYDICECTLGQFTGSYDKQGNEVYEKDILYHPRQGYRKVIYPMDNRCAFFGLEGIKGEKNTLQDTEQLYTVVGNMLCNQDLFK